MTARELRRLLREGEGPHLEFKRAEIKSSDLAESLAALANSGGGLVLVGVNDFGAIVGVRSRKDALDLVSTAARECVKPAIEVTASEVRLPRGQSIIAVRIPRAKQPVLSSSGRVLVRRGSRNVPATPEEVEQLFAGVRATDGGAFPYEILNHDVRLELLDADGEHAVLTRVARVRFLQDQVLALHDRIWGEGELNLNGHITPGTVVDRFTKDRELHQLVSLREPKHRGELATIDIVHRVQRVFSQAKEWFEIDVDLPTKNLRVEIRFPSNRPPVEAWLFEQGGGRKRALSGSNLVRTATRTRIVWRRRNPPLHQRYRTEWIW